MIATKATLTRQGANGWSVEVDAGQLTIDMQWMPYAQAQVTIPRPSFIPVDRFEVLTLRIEATDLDTAGTSYRDHHLMLLGFTTDAEEQTITFELASCEAFLMELRNGGPAWSSSLAGSAIPIHELWQELLEYIGADTFIALGVLLGLPGVSAADVEPWQPGQTAWAWMDRLRTLTDTAYSATGTGINLYMGGPWPIGTSPGGALSYQYEYWPAEFADATRITWRWIDSQTGEPQEQVDVAPATGWRTSTRWAEIERLGPPVPGAAERIQDRRGQLRSRIDATYPYSRSLVNSTPVGYTGLQWSSVTYVFGDQPVIHGTLFATN